jgi:hypothetical protein
MSDVWHPLDPEGSRPQEPSAQQALFGATEEEEKEGN